MPADYAALPDEALIDLLFTEEDRLPRAAVDEILRRKPAGRLSDILKNDETWETDGPESWAVVHAAYLLAAFRPPGSLDLLIDAVDRAEDYANDWIAEESPYMLAAYGPAAIPALRAAALDRRRDPYVRVWMNAALGLLGKASKEALDALRRTVDDVRCDETVRAAAADDLLDYALPEDRERILAAADGDFLKTEDVEAAYQAGPREPEPAYDWLGFYDPEEIAARESADPEEVEEEEVEAPDGEAPPPPLRADPKTGRNDPCPCGSDKKFKKCCGK